MKTLNAWIKAHPYTAIAYVFLFTLIAACMAVVSEHGFWFGLILFVSLIVCWIIGFYFADSKLPIILTFAFATTSLQAAEPPRDSVGGVAVGVVVICVGGYCVYRVVKFCQRKFPKESAGTNSTSAFIPQAEGESAASWNYGSIGSCDPTLTPGPELLSQESGTLFTIDVSIDKEGNASVGIGADNTATQSWADFQAEVARHGVQITGNADNSQYFSTNRVPCSPTDVAIAFDALTKTVDLKDSGGPVTVIEVERSGDLQSWTPFLRTAVGAGGRGLRIQDATTTTSMFYRVNISNL